FRPAVHRIGRGGEIPRPKGVTVARLRLPHPKTSPEELMTPVHVTTWTDGEYPEGRVVFVHGSQCWATDPVAGFGHQRPLAARYHLELMDRRGYGQSPDTERGDYEVDADDVGELLQGGAHLVGHSYGGVVAMLA